MKRLLVFAFTALTLFAALNTPAPPADERQEVIERVIKIEGTVEKPRVIFILPRARLWKEEFLRKSFVSDILKPVYPESVLKESGF